MNESFLCWIIYSLLSSLCSVHQAVYLLRFQWALREHPHHLNGYYVHDIIPRSTLYAKRDVKNVQYVMQIELTASELAKRTNTKMLFAICFQF